MEDKSQFLHVGVTVSDIDRTVAFYQKYFGFELEFKDRFPAEFIGAFPQLYKQKEGVYSDFAFIKSPDGIVLELFQFSDMLPAKEAIWNTPGYHHICLKVENVPEKCKELEADGVELYFQPGFRGDPANEEYWVFLKDPDGLMIELQ